MKTPGVLILSVIVAAGAGSSLSAAEPRSFAELNPERITAIEKMLPDRPAGLSHLMATWLA